MNGFKIKQQLRKAEHLSQKGKYTDALRVLRELVFEVKEEAPDVYTLGLIRIGDIYRKQGAEQSAATNYRQALSLMRQNTDLEKVIPEEELLRVYTCVVSYCEIGNLQDEIATHAERELLLADRLGVYSEEVRQCYRLYTDHLHKQGRDEDAKAMLSRWMEKETDELKRSEICYRELTWFSAPETMRKELKYCLVYYENKVGRCLTRIESSAHDPELLRQLGMLSSLLGRLRESCTVDQETVQWPDMKEEGYLCRTWKDLEANITLYLVRYILPKDPEGKCKPLTELIVELLQDMYGAPFIQMYTDLADKMNDLQTVVNKCGIGYERNEFTISNAKSQKEIPLLIAKASVEIEKAFRELETAEYPVILGESELKQQQGLLLDDGRSQLLFMIKYVFRRYRSTIRIWPAIYDRFAEKCGAEDSLAGQLDMLSVLPDAVEFFDLRGWELFNSGQYRKAEFFFDQAVMLTLQRDGDLRDYEKNRDLVKGALRTAYRLGKYDKALVFAREREQLILEHMKENEKNQETDPSLVETYSYLMAIYTQLKNRSEAVTYYNKTKAEKFELLHFSVMAYAMVDSLCGSGPNDSYIDHVKKKCELFNLNHLRINRKPLLAVIGLDHKRKQQYAEAADHFLKALQNCRNVKSMELNGEAMPFGEDGILLVNLLSSVICAGDAVPKELGMKAVELACVYMVDRCIKAYEIYDEEERYVYLRVCRHLMSLCHSYSLRNPGLFIGREIRDLALCAAGVGGRISVRAAGWLVRENDHIRSAYDRLLSLRKQQQAECPGFTLDHLTSTVGQEIHRLEGEVLHCLARADKKEKLESLQFVFDRDLPSGSLILHFGSFYYTDGIYDEEGYVGDSLGLEKNEDFPYARYYYMTLYFNKVTRIFYLDKTTFIDQVVKEYTEELKASGDGGIQRALWDILLLPAAVSIDHAKHLYIVPEGELCKVPFELLEDENGKRLMDMVDSVEYLSSVQRIRDNVPEQKDQRKMMIIADPAFHIQADGTAGTDKEVVSSGFVRDPGADFFRNGIAPLPGTALESSAVQRIGESAKMQVICYEGEAANKKQLEDIRADIVHFATHSFAFPQSRDRLEERTRDGLFYGTWFSHAPNPLQRCGLILAGAENALQGAPVSECGDGIMTGYEVLSRDMSGVRLLVLAACNSGAGFIQNGEGLRGLRSAFEVAGVKNIICSLWEVPDIPAAILMNDLYRAFLLEQRSLSEALNTAREKLKGYTGTEVKEILHSLQAQSERTFHLNERELDLLDLAEPEERPFAAPYFWAGFIRIRCG